MRQLNFCNQLIWQVELLSLTSKRFFMTPRPPSPPDSQDLQAVLLAVRQAADMLCDRWTLLVLLYAFSGVSKSGDFRARTGIASRQLSQRLESLVAQEIVVRMPYSRRPLRLGTHLTTMGRELFDVFSCMVAWETKHEPSKNRTSVQIRHSSCTQPYSAPVLICAHCQTGVYARDVVVRRSQRQQPEDLPLKQSTYRRSKEAAFSENIEPPLAKAIGILGDKWTIEILVIALFRVEGFLEIQNLTGISTNILSDRLSRLVDTGLLRQMSAGEGSRKGAYRITEKGIGFYPVLIAIQKWADEWLPDRLRSPMNLEHRPCAKKLSLTLTCDHCQQPLTFADATFEISTTGTN